MVVDELQVMGEVGSAAERQHRGPREPHQPDEGAEDDTGEGRKRTRHASRRGEASGTYRLP